MFRPTAILLFVLVTALAQPQSVKVEKYKLANGMTVILHEDHSQPIVAVNIWYKVGSKDEAERRSGFAHLFEHLMFMGTKRVPNGQFDVLMEKYGGSNNASTWEDKTNYYESGPSSLLPTLLWLEADRLEGLALDMDLKKLDLQREVVKNERREGVENAPYGKANDAINGLMFPKGHPYHTTVIGSMEDLNAAAVQDVKDFFNTYYVPNNASLVIAGDFNPKEIKPLVSKLFGTLPRGNDIVRKAVPPLTLGGIKRTTMVDTVQVPKTIMVWHSPAAFKPGDIEMRLAGSVLSGGYTSRLYQSLVVQKQLATDVAAYQNPMLLGSTFTVDATAREGVALDKLEKAIDETLAKFRAEGPTKAELDRQLAQVSFQAVNGLQSLQQRADKINEFEFYFGNPNSFAKEQQLFKAVTPASLKAVAAKALNPNRRLILRVIPQGDPPKSNQRETQPTVGASKPFAFPLPTEFKLANGIPVYYWQKSDLPLTTLALRFDQGASFDAAGSSGLSELTADMLDEGAGPRDAEAFSNALDQLGAQLSIGASQEGTTVSLTSLSEKFEPSLALMADAVLRPKLGASDWDRIKSLHLEGLATEDDDPSTLATKTVNREFFGRSHPYSRSVSGTKETVTKLKLADIKARYATIANPSEAAIYASGSLSVEKFKALLGKQFGGWKAKGRSIASKHYPEVVADRQRLVIVDKPGAVQTVIKILMPSETFSSPNRYALTELGVVMGGTFTSRINRNLREEKGYTYGAGLQFAFSKPANYIVASTSVRADVTGASLKELLGELARVKTGDLTDEEASKARNTIRANFIDGIGTRQGLVGIAISYRENGIPFSQIGQELDRFAKVELAQLNELAKTGIPFDRAVIVLVGDREQIVKQLEGLGLPEPEIMKG
ncbi:MAG: insulinase family protein [Chlorobia bacterium]|nr:insulinase family protein [Fimbriimonadaceae bacterium]